MTVTSKQNWNVLIVLGMHRSGTSALTGVLSMLGADPGPSLVPGQEGVNPKGFWEHAEIVDIHERLLESLDSSWQDERPLPDFWWQLPAVSPFRESLRFILQRDFGQSSLWILKDPRMCRLMPLWLDLLQEMGCSPHFIICLRNPIEVALSLEHRDGIPKLRSYLLWLTHTLEAERSSRGYPRVAIDYGDLLKDWQAIANKIRQDLQLPLIADESSNVRITNFLERPLRHHQALNEAAGPDGLALWADEVYKAMLNMPLNVIANVLAPIDKNVNDAVSIIAPWTAQIVAISIRTKRLDHDCKWAQSEIERIKATVSWNITKPIRLLAFLFRKAVGMGQAILERTPSKQVKQHTHDQF